MGDFQATELTAAARFGTMPKRNNRYIIYTIDTLKQAIANNKQVSFKYYSLDYQKNRVYRNGGERYIVDPLVVVWNKDNYYLVCYDNKHDGTATYRIDRMTEAQEEATDRAYRKEFADFDIEKYRQRVFSMFGGDEQEITLQFDTAMLDDVFDKFGEDVNIVKVDDDTYSIDCVTNKIYKISPEYTSAYSFDISGKYSVTARILDSNLDELTLYSDNKVNLSQSLSANATYYVEIKPSAAMTVDVLCRPQPQALSFGINNLTKNSTNILHSFISVDR